MTEEEKQIWTSTIKNVLRENEEWDDKNASERYHVVFEDIKMPPKVVLARAFDHIEEKYPELERVYQTIKRHCEANCFTNGKKGDIVPSLAIMNLKSNHGWTDRVDNTTKGKEVSTTTIINLGEGKEPDNK